MLAPSAPVNCALTKPSSTAAHTLHGPAAVSGEKYTQALSPRANCDFRRSMPAGRRQHNDKHIETISAR